MTKKHLLKIVAGVIVFIPVLTLISLSFFSSKPRTIDLNRLEWDSDPSLVLINNIEQNGDQGIMSVRLTDGAPFFIPGQNWRVSFSNEHAFVFNKKDVWILSNDTVRDLHLAEEDPEIISVEQSTDKERLLLVTRDPSKTVLCILPLSDLERECQLLQLNKPTDAKWSLNDHMSIGLLNTEGQLYSYDIATGKTKNINETEQPEIYREFVSLFAAPEKTTDMFLFGNTLFVKQDTSWRLFSVSARTVSAKRLDDNHVLLQQKDTLQILEIETNSISTLVDMLNIEDTSIFIR